MTKYHVTVVVTREEPGQEIWDDNGSSGYDNYLVEQKVYSLEDFAKQPFFVDLIKENGFFSKEEILISDLTHLNNFVYQYGDTYKYYTSNINEIGANCGHVSVYQEVVGPERIKQVKKLLDRRNIYLEKEAALKLKQQDKAAASREKARLRRIEKARSLLAENTL